MKFHQLPIGSHFSYQQKRYCKTGPLAATDEDGNQRMIPRAVQVTPAEAADKTAGSNAATSPLLDALQQYHHRSLALFAEAASEQPEVRRQAMLKALEDNYRELLETLPEDA